jgi:L-amino acid N-acyltransferase YncA
VTSVLLLDDPDALLAWASRRLGGLAFADDARAIGWGMPDHIRAVAVFDHFIDSDCQFNLASDGSARWLGRQFLAAIAHYVFVLAGKRRCTARVSVHNIASIRFTTHGGFRCEGVLREAGPRGEDVMLFGMVRRECRYLPAYQRKG